MFRKIVNNESLVVLLYTLISMIGALAIMKILAITLTKEDFGVYALILSIVSFIALFPFKCLDQGASRYVSINRSENSFSEFYSNYLFLLLVAIIFYISIFSIIDSLNIELSVFSEYIWTIFFFLTSEVVKTSFRTIVGAERKRIEILISNSLEFGLKVLILIIFIQDITLNIVLYLFIIINFISTIKLYLENKNELKLSVVNKVTFLFHNKRLWLFSYPFLIMAIFTWARDMSNRWIIDIYLDKESVAIYSILTSITIIIPMGIQTILGSYIVPIIYQKENTKQGFARRVTNILLLTLPILFLIIGLFIYIFAHEIITLFSSEEYIYHSWAFTSLFLAYSIYTLAMFSVYELLANNESKKLITPSIISGVLSVVSGLILINMYGLNGAIYSYLIGYISYAILIFIVVWKFRRKNV
ncbi:MAG: oligosaccharide flippase family protein [Sulfurovum sp.]|nr:oligosaccharide flippase family protein [Sulfurovum sp.]